MIRNSLVPAFIGASSVLLSACTFLQEAQPPRQRPPAKPMAVRAPTPAVSAAGRSASRTDGTRDGSTPVATEDERKPAAAPVRLVGLGEQELRELLGPPAAEEERPPGKVWHYRKGRCTLDVSLYPDVQTRKFGTLTYEVKSDDNTDEGKRICLAELQSRGQAR
jgi:hypothetical protein